MTSSSAAVSCCHGVAPLSPFLWKAPPRGVIVPVGCEPGLVADVCVQAKELSLRFEQLAQELDGPYFHPVSEAIKTHPVHTHSFSKHQFDVLRYGVVLDHSAGLVLVPVPRQCGDSGAIVAQGYSALTGADLNDTAAAQHPLHEEYVFVVYQLTTDSSDASVPPAAKALFRLVFRNEAYLNHSAPEQSAHFPVFILRAIYISNDEFYRVHEVIAAHRKYHQEPVNPETGSRSADLRLLQELQRPQVIAIADAWLQVLEGIVSTRFNFESVSTNASLSTGGAAGILSSPRRTRSDAAVPLFTSSNSTLLNDQRYPLLRSRAIRTSYYHSAKRMQARIDIVKKTRELISEWRSGAFDVDYFSTESLAGEPTQLKSNCIRVLFRETRSGRNFIEDGELVAFLPQESDTERLQVYDNLAAERVRLWVLKALLTADLQGVHVLLMELDTALMIAQCVGLLRGSESNRDKEVLFHLCKIFVETVEDYLQHSGNLWRVTIAVADRPSISDANGLQDTVDVVALCRDILECIALSKHRLELEAISGASADATDDANQKESALQAAARALTAPNLTPEQLAAQRSALSENVIFAATTHRVFVTDEKLYPLFQYCDTNNDGFVSVPELVKLFLCKENKISRDHMQKRGAYEPPMSDHEALRLQASNLVAHPLCALDGCGLPFNEKSVYDFVRSFCKHSPTTSGSEESLNYVEFSMMMLALAKR